MSDYDVASKMGLPVPDTIEDAVRQRDGWINAAAMHHRNEEYYRGLIDRIGVALGPDAYTSDDGSVQDSVRRSKVPELVLARLAPIEPTEAMLNAARDWSAAKYGRPIGNGAAIGCWRAMQKGRG
jgi:hypothetical protein